MTGGRSPEKKQWQPWAYRNRFGRYIAIALILGGFVLTIFDLLQGNGISINPGIFFAIVAYMFYVRGREKRYSKDKNTAESFDPDQ